MDTIKEIIKYTSHWNMDMWHDFRNVFHPYYYDKRNNESRDKFNIWKLKEIKKFNTLLIKF